MRILLACAVQEGLAGERPLNETLMAYERRRNEATMADYHKNIAQARFDPVPAELLEPSAAIKRIRNSSSWQREGIFRMKSYPTPTSCSESIPSPPRWGYRLTYAWVGSLPTDGRTQQGQALACGQLCGPRGHMGVGWSRFQLIIQVVHPWRYCVEVATMRHQE